MIISSREFRANQGKYLNMVAQGGEVILKSRDIGSFKILPVTEDDTLMSKEEFYKKIDKSLEQIKAGKGIAKQDGESMDNFLTRLCTE